MSKLEKKSPADYEWPALSSSGDEAGGDFHLEARRKIRLLLQEAQKEAARIRAGADGEVRRAVQEARRAGSEAFAVKAEQCAEVLRIIEEEAKKLPAVWREELEPQAVILSTRIAEKIIRRQLRLDPQDALNGVRAGLRLLPDHVEFSVFVNPEDLKTWREAHLLGETLAKRFQPSSQVKTGSFEIQSTLGYTNGSLRRQISRIRNFLVPAARDKEKTRAA